MNRWATSSRAASALRRGLGRVGPMWTGALDEVFPRITDETGVDAAGRPWTPDPPGSYCPRCGASAGPGAATSRGCAFCHGRRFAWRGVTRLGEYAPPLDERIRGMKFAGQWPWAAWFGRRLAEALESGCIGERAVVCPVPMHWGRRWRRGFNQAELMALALGKARGCPTAKLLRRVRRTPPQTVVPPSQRPANVRGSFAPRRVKNLTGREVILVDDVKTSGATLSACARLLREAGAVDVHCAVAAVADPANRGFKMK